MKRRGAFLAVWVLAGFFYFFFANEWITAGMNDKSFSEYMGHVIDLAATEHRPAKEVRSMLLVRAESLDIPLEGQQIEITGEGKTLRAKVEYETDVKMPLVNSSLYRMKFTHDVTHKEPR
jgi:uncharacterized ubiquitin-like protein YukD